MSRIIDTLVRERKISRSEAERALQDFLANNEMAILSAMTLTIPKVEETTPKVEETSFLYDSLDDALTARHERFGTPKCYVCISSPITACGSASDFYPLAILYVTVKRHDREWNCFMLACDVNTLSTDYDVTLMELWAPMKQHEIPNPDIRGIVGEWDPIVSLLHSSRGPLREYTMVAEKGPIEWYDENYQYHVTEKGGVAGPGIYWYRKYYD